MSFESNLYRKRRINKYLDKVVDALDTSPEEARRILESRSVRLMKYRGLEYLTFRRDMGKILEGSLILLGKKPRLVPGYPPIQRILLLRRISRHFPGPVAVEEKMNGYNVRVLSYEDKILAITRGGFICPYTTARINKLYGNALKDFFEEHNEYILFGEVIGLENPYTRYAYPESPSFDYYVFDILTGTRQWLDLKTRREIVSAHGLKNVPLLDTINKNDYSKLVDIINDLETRRREGVVLKDPENRVPPLKYTTGYSNIDDLRLGMKYPFEEGRSFLFSRILREIFRAVEVYDNETLERNARELGYAILLPAVESIKKIIKGEVLAEEFQLRFTNSGEIEEFIDYMRSLGIDIAITSLEYRDGELVVNMLKPKKSTYEIKRILETGYSPLD